jgi:hypothetical protein
LAKKYRRRAAPSPKRHRKRGLPRITCRRFARFASNPVKVGARARTFPKIFFTGDCALSTHLGAAAKTLPAHAAAAASDAAMKLMTLQNPLWNRGFAHF